MMKAREEEFRQSLLEKTPEEIIEIAVSLFCEKIDVQAKLSEMQKASTEMSIQFQQMKDELKAANDQIKELLKQNRHLTDTRILNSRDLFGRSTEKTADLIKNAMEDEEGAGDDPLDEDAGCGNGDGTPKENGQTQNPGKKGKKGKKRKEAEENGEENGKKKSGKKKGKRDSDLSGLPHTTVYDYDINEYNALYGEGNWRFAFWHQSQTVEIVRQQVYVQVTYTPVLSVGLEHSLVAIPNTTSLLPKSLVSPSLLAMLYTERYQMFLPLYRLEHNPWRLGMPISRQTMSNWIVRFAMDLLVKPYEHMKEQVKCAKYQQCDETIWPVILDGRPAGTNGFVWTHRTSELMDGPEIIVYCFELSRAAEHLIRFYEGIKEEIFLTCDAYSAYPSASAALLGLLIICGCFMHVRRRFVKALNVIDMKDLAEEQIENLPEVKALDLLKELYAVDEPLKELPVAERTEKRNTQTRKAADAFFSFVNEFDVDAPGVSEKMKDAIQYARNQEVQLRHFLEDGNIPIDDGATERSIRPIAISRANSLFSNTIKGAEASMIVSSLVETARRNGADPYYYLKYLLEELPKHALDKDESYLEDMMPWSEAYQSYEKAEKLKLVNGYAPPGNEKPHTPKKRDQKAKAC